MILLTMTEDLNTIELASKKGIVYEVYTLDDINKVRLERMQPVIIAAEP